jgi:hypothetical protein
MVWRMHNIREQLQISVRFQKLFIVPSSRCSCTMGCTYWLVSSPEFSLCHNYFIVMTLNIEMNVKLDIYITKENKL